VDVLTTLQICARRWYIFVPVLAVAVLGAFQYSRTFAPTYTATNVLFVLPSSTVTITPNANGTTQINPLDSSSSSNRVAALALAQLLASPAVGNQIAAKQTGAAFSAQASTDSSGTVTVVATARTSKAAVETLNAAQGAADSTFRQLQLQLGAPKSGLLQIVPAAQVTTAVRSFPSKTKYLAAIVVAGLLLAVLLAAAIDAVADRRRARARGSARHRVDDATRQDFYAEEADAASANSLSAQGATSSESTG
jgi:hypothetical protein